MSQAKKKTNKKQNKKLTYYYILFLNMQQCVWSAKTRRQQTVLFGSELTCLRCSLMKAGHMHQGLVLCPFVLRLFCFNPLAYYFL